MKWGKKVGFLLSIFGDRDQSENLVKMRLGKIALIAFLEFYGKTKDSQNYPPNFAPLQFHEIFLFQSVQSISAMFIGPPAQSLEIAPIMISMIFCDKTRKVQNKRKTSNISRKKLKVATSRQLSLIAVS